MFIKEKFYCIITTIVFYYVYYYLSSYVINIEAVTPYACPNKSSWSFGLIFFIILVGVIFIYFGIGVPVMV
jgi:hypothetical protein